MCSTHFCWYFFLQFLGFCCHHRPLDVVHFSCYHQYYTLSSAAYTLVCAMFLVHSVLVLQCNKIYLLSHVSHTVPTSTTFFGFSTSQRWLVHANKVTKKIVFPLQTYKLSKVGQLSLYKFTLFPLTNSLMGSSFNFSNCTIISFVTY